MIMKQTLTSFFCIIIFLSSYSQQQTKLSYHVAKSANITDKHRRQERISVLVRGDVSEIKRQTEELGGIFKYSSGDIAAITIPIKNLRALAKSKNISRMEGRPVEMQFLSDTLLVRNNITGIQSGEFPLSQQYDGTGVVLGFIDSGIDFSHPDFQDNDGKSRVQFLWDQTKDVAANTPQPYGYGQEWSGVQIDAGLASAHTDLAHYGHGTHTVGIAAGNGRTINRYKGIAPKADIIFVAYNYNSSAANTVADAVNYIFTKAKALGKPCVVNASLGSFYGSHDGKDMETQLIDRMITAQNGRVMVASAGNSGETHFHLGYDVTSDTSFTWIKNNSSYNGAYIELWADTSDFKNVKFAIGADQKTPAYSFRGNTHFSDISNHLSGNIQHDTIFNNGNRIGVVESYAELVGGTYTIYFFVTPDSSQYLFRLMTTGSGRFDAWTNDMVFTDLPSEAVLPDIVHYKSPDQNQTIATGFQCSPNVITVGNYVNRKSYLDYNNNLVLDTSLTPGALSRTSSFGPTRDGRIKPDISASGEYTLSCAVLSMVPGFIISNPEFLAQGGKHIIGGGTSSSAPIVAGIAALYLQKNPNASNMEVRNAIVGTAKQDIFTGNKLPDNSWGYGKVDGLRALTEYGSINFTKITESSFCQGDSIDVAFKASNMNNMGNMLNVELSDASGDFSNPMEIGKIKGDTVGVVKALIPHSLAEGTGYLVRLKATNPVIFGNDNLVNIAIHPIPVLLSHNTSICLGSGTVLSATGAINYTWTPARDLSASTGAIVTANPSVNTTYSMNGISPYSCVNSAKVNIVVKPLLHVSLPIENTTICKGATVILSAEGADKYTWSPSTGIDITNGATVRISPVQNMTYQVMGADLNNHACPDTAFINIVVNPLPEVSLSSFDTTCIGNENNTIELTGGFPPGGVYFGDGVKEGFFIPGISGVGEHVITYFYEDLNGCSNTISKINFIENCTGVKDLVSSISLNIYPNPFLESTLLKCSLSGLFLKHNVEIKIFNSIGKLVKVLSINEIENNIVLSRGELQSGIYVCHISVNGKTYKTEKLILL